MTSRPPPWPIRLARSVMSGLVGAALLFAGLALTPEPWFQLLLDGLRPSTARPSPRLQLLEFSHQRTPGQFHLYIRLANPGPTPLADVQAIVGVRDGGGQPLDTLVYPIEPEALTPGAATAFTVTFARDLPVRHYSIRFKNSRGESIPHDLER